MRLVSLCFFFILRLVGNKILFLESDKFDVFDSFGEVCRGGLVWS